jgi:hypothetical protein
MGDAERLPGIPRSSPPRLLLISFTTNYGDDNLLHFGTIQTSDQIGVVSTLPPWRRLLATFNWRPVYDIEQRTKQLKSEIEQLDTENRRLAALNSRMDALLRNADSSLRQRPQPAPTECSRVAQLSCRLTNAAHQCATLKPMGRLHWNEAVYTEVR